jgi:hypothetical protein
MPYLNMDEDEDMYPLDKTSGKVIKPENIDMLDNAKRISDCGEYGIYSAEDSSARNSKIIYAVLNDRATIEMVVQTYPNNQIQIRSLESTRDNKLPVAKLYLQLLDMGYEIVSDSSQTMGGKKLWLALFKQPNLKFYTAKEQRGNTFSEWIDITNKLTNPEHFWSTDEDSEQAETVLKVAK